MTTARTLAEAHVYVNLLQAEGLPPVDTTLTEGAQAWTLSHGPVEVTVPYRSEQLSRTSEVTFGIGESTLVDAAQWVLVAATFARRALEGDLRPPGTPVEVREVERDWTFAAEAQGEALKLLVHSPTPIWSEQGRQAVAEDPGSYAPQQVAEDHAYYRGTLDDFRALHGLPE